MGLALGQVARLHWWAKQARHPPLWALAPRQEAEISEQQVTEIQPALRRKSCTMTDITGGEMEILERAVSRNPKKPIRPSRKSEQKMQRLRGRKEFPGSGEYPCGRRMLVVGERQRMKLGVLPGARTMGEDFRDSQMAWILVCWPDFLTLAST